MAIKDRLHIHDLSLDGQELRKQLIENFTIIGDAIGGLDKYQKETNDRLDKLDAEKATHDELKDVQEAWKKKIEHVALGTDYETVEQAVMQILKEKGMI